MTTLSVNKDGWSLKPSITATLEKTVWQFLTLNTPLGYDLEIRLCIYIYPGETKTCPHRCLAFFIITQTENNPNVFHQVNV